jgi:hypothetical protein
MATRVSKSGGWMSAMRSFREESNLGAAEVDRADRNALSHQGDAEQRTEAQEPRALAALGKLVRLVRQVSHVDGPPVQHRSASPCPADEREGELAGRPNGDWAVMGDQAEPIAVPAVDLGV